jgi:hypothetical protein
MKLEIKGDKLFKKSMTFSYQLSNFFVKAKVS